MLKGHNILPTIASFFMSSAGKIKGVREFKVNFSSNCSLRVTVIYRSYPHIQQFSMKTLFCIFEIMSIY